MFVFCCGPVISATKNLRQEDHIVEASMGHIAKLRFKNKCCSHHPQRHKVFCQLRPLVLTFYT